MEPGTSGQRGCHPNPHWAGNCVLGEAEAEALESCSLSEVDVPACKCLLFLAARTFIFRCPRNSLFSIECTDTQGTSLEVLSWSQWLEPSTHLKQKVRFTELAFHRFLETLRENSEALQICSGHLLSPALFLWPHTASQLFFWATVSSLSLHPEEQLTSGLCSLLVLGCMGWELDSAHRFPQ